MKYKKITSKDYINFLSNINSLKLPMVVEVMIDEKLPYQPRIKSRVDEKEIL